MAQQVAMYVNPILAALKRLGNSGRPAEVCEAVAAELKSRDLPVVEGTLKSGVSRFEKTIAYVRLNLALAGYIDRSERGVWTLTKKGRDSPPLSDAEANEIFLEIQRQGKKVRDAEDDGSKGEDEPRDVGREDEESDYKAQLLETIRGLSPKGFEQLCQRLLRESGFEPVVVTGRSGDGGIDGHGVLQVNPLVTFKVLFQCKKYVGKVGSPEIRAFRGAMQGRADKGIILTTGAFSASALEEAARDGAPPIEMVDGKRLVGLFESLELGLVRTYDVDPSFFSEFDSSNDNSSP